MGVLTRIWYTLLFILIVGLVIYDNVWWMERTLNIRNIERETQFFGKVINISKEHFYMDIGSSNIRIESSDMPKVNRAKYGETVVHVIRRKDGLIKGIGYHNYNYNYLLYFFSFIAFLIFLIIFFKEWKLTLRGFEDA